MSLVKLRMEGIYQIVYSSQIVKEMSGDAILNSQGEVIGINRMYPYPLWVFIIFMKIGQCLKLIYINK